MRLSPEVIDRARAVPIQDELAHRGIRLRLIGTELIGRCPVCGGGDRFAINTQKRIGGGAAQSTVEALMLSLRWHGIQALDEPNTRHRISQLNEEQLHEVGARLQRIKPEIARAWTAEDVGRLVETWVACHA
jgi:hypothetical protein